MNVKTKTIENTDNFESLVLSLIRSHYETDLDFDFKSVCREVAEYFDRQENSQLAAYVRSMIGDEPSWIPM